MVDQSTNPAKPDRGPWFGQSSPTATAGVLMVNVLPLLISPLLGAVALAILIPLELVIACVLVSSRNESREIGSGILVAVLTCALTFALLAALAYVSEHF